MPFPSDFLWGAATSAHQVEGGNTASDWWAWEKAGLVPFPSDRASDHWNRYDSDFELARSLGHNAHRLSIEWSRIEPREGRWNEDAITHYRNVIAALKSHGLEPVVTLHHFTNPKWFSDRGGWSHRDAPDTFLRYVRRVVEALGNGIRYWLTINEPLVYVYQTNIARVWPSPRPGLGGTVSSIRNLERAHMNAYSEIHRVLGSKGERPRVGMAKAFVPLVPCRPSHPLDRAACFLRDYVFNRRMVERLARRRTLDFIGVNYYTRHFIRWGGKGPLAGLGCTCPESHGHTKRQRNVLGWEIYPQGLLEILKRLDRYNLPILITENGAAVDEDSVREEFIVSHLEMIHKALREGVPILGYLYWSLLDNFEWAEGTRPRFGLVEVNYKDFARSIRPSARRYSRIVQKGSLDSD